MLLAIDTSTDTASLALVLDRRIVAEMAWRCGRNHTRHLLPNLDHLLRQQDAGPESITAVVVARGPGSFNGLRVGVGAAKGIAFSLGVPIVGVSSLEAEAYQHAATGLPIYPVFDAGRGEVATALYRQCDGVWRQLGDERITTAEGLCQGVSARTVFCGEYITTIAGQLQERLGQDAVIPSTVTGMRRAGYLAELGLRRLDAGEPDDVAALQPVYLRRPSITRAKHH